MFFSRKESVLIPTQTFRVAIIGNSQREEFHPVKSAISQLTEVVLFPDISSIDDPCYDLLFLLESWPGEYGEKEILKYRKVSPLCRMILIAGALAEGEKRTGAVPDGLFRYYTWQQHNLLKELDCFLHHRKTFWNEPFTLTPEETGLQETETFRHLLQKIPDSKKKVSLVCADLSIKEFLEDFCQQEQYQLAAENASPNLVILDDTGLSIEAVVEKLQFHRKQNKDVRLFVLWNAPRWDEKKMLHENGADQVFAKP